MEKKLLKINPCKPDFCIKINTTIGECKNQVNSLRDNNIIYKTDEEKANHLATQFNNNQLIDYLGDPVHTNYINNFFENYFYHTIF